MTVLVKNLNVYPGTLFSVSLTHISWNNWVTWSPEMFGKCNYQHVLQQSSSTIAHREKWLSEIACAEAAKMQELNQVLLALQVTSSCEGIVRFSGMGRHICRCSCAIAHTKTEVWQWHGMNCSFDKMGAHNLLWIEQVRACNLPRFANSLAVSGGSGRVGMLWEGCAYNFVRAWLCVRFRSFREQRCKIGVWASSLSGRTWWWLCVFELLCGAECEGLWYVFFPLRDSIEACHQKNTHAWAEATRWQEASPRFVARIGVRGQFGLVWWDPVWTTQEKK